ncbi:MAG: hypothetical protein HQK78_08915 [Desulfobacterales bacterium]|nr:hypothetical protein [Desulfobacterales bacterium]
MNPKTFIQVIVFCLFLPINAMGWTNHATLAYPIFFSFPEVKNASSIKVETIEHFLKTEQKGLVRLLYDEDVWAKKNIYAYPHSLERIKFRDNILSSELKTRFLMAIRVNPYSRLVPYIQILNSDDKKNNTILNWQDVSLIKSDYKYLDIKPGEIISAFEILTTACDEPDNGLDIGVWEDNNTEFGKIYGFGNQPFGNPKLEYSSQAPFHMGFFHESDIIYLMASFIKKTYVEYRIHLYQSLAKYAFETGHKYWGFRFMGWGMHYVQDLTQPYHSTLLPGISVPSMLWINLLDNIAIRSPKNDALQLVTNRHLAIENYQYNLLKEAIENYLLNHNLTKALGDSTNDSQYVEFTNLTPRKVISKKSNSYANETDKILERCLPKRLVSEPSYIFEKTEPDINVLSEIRKNEPEAEKILEELLIKLLVPAGAHSRNYFRSILPSAQK